MVLTKTFFVEFPWKRGLSSIRNGGESLPGMLSLTYVEESRKVKVVATSVWYFVTNGCSVCTMSCYMVW